MAGPGGGGRGGGGAGGSFRGGGGGGFGGGYHHPHHHHHHYMHRYGFGPRFIFFGGPMFFGGGLMGILLMPLLIIAFLGLFIALLLSSVISAFAQGGQIVYNEETFQDYTNGQYYTEFADENAIMIVMLTGEEHDGYYYIGWVGDNIQSDINLMFGNEYTELGQAMSRNVNQNNYKYSLSSNLSMVLEDMTDEIVALGLQSSFKRAPVEPQNKAVLRNYTDLGISADTVQPELDRFLEETGISVALVVEDAEDVFGKTMPWMEIILCVILLIFLLYIVYSAIQSVRYRKKAEEKQRRGEDLSGSFGNYNDFNP